MKLNKLENERSLETFKELTKFKERIECKNRVIVEDYELTRDSNEYSLVLYSDLDIRYIIDSGRCSYYNEKLEVVGKYEQIQRVLHKLERERIISQRVLGMIYADLWNLRERCIYVKENEGEMIIYSDYELDKHLTIEGWGYEKNYLKGNLIEYSIKHSPAESVIKNLDSNFFIQVI